VLSNRSGNLIAGIREEHQRWIKLIGRADPYIGKVTIGIHEVLQAHFLLAEYFAEVGEGLGGLGPKDINLLHSALSRQFVEYGGKPKWSDGLDVCATLMFGLIKNHPFYDANKRTAFLTSILHLQKIGKTPTIKDTDYEDFTVSIADNKLDELPNMRRRFDSPSPDREIAIISHFLRRSTRDIDLKGKFITYAVLNGILNKRGLRLDNPRHNRIDVIRFNDFDGNPMARPVRITKIGFHAWTTQVSMKDIDTVRQATALDASHGYDSQAFFNGLDDPLTLIKKYREPLQRLAFR
jgi:death-on-curing protein